MRVEDFNLIYVPDAWRALIIEKLKSNIPLPMTTGTCAQVQPDKEPEKEVVLAVKAPDEDAHDIGGVY